MKQLIMETRSIFQGINRITKPLSSVPKRERTKLTGALAIEAVRHQLLKSGFTVSGRDVFIGGIPTEFDTLVVRPTAKPAFGIVYNPSDVAALLEIKFSGAYSQQVLPHLRQLFDRVNRAHPHIQCIYVTVCERRTYKYRITSKALGWPSFTLNWWTDYKNSDVCPGDAFEEVVTCIHSALSKAEGSVVEK
ncbi:MAG: hypothetical protein ABSG78_16225 [Verrucomicrobiota bacterium]